MNRNLALLVAAVTIIGLALGVVYVLPLLEDALPMDSSVEFLDRDGNVVATSTQMAIYAGTAEVVSMTVKARWTVDASNIDPATFNAQVEVEVSVLNWDADVYELLDTKSVDFTAMVQESYVEVHTWTLTTLLQEYMTDAHKADGWKLRIRATLTPTAKDSTGVDVTPDPPSQSAPVVFADLTWVDTTASMTVVAFEVNRWLPLAP